MERIQRYGGYLAAMVLPNIGAILAWGLITAFVIPTGWTPNEQIAAVVGPMINFMLPLLIGYTGGKLVYGHRGGVVGAIATFGVAVGAGILAVAGVVYLGPWFAALSDTLGNGVKAIIDAGLLPLADLPIEVGKVLFLNNAINHGVLAPLGIAAAAANPDHRALHFL